MSKSFKARLNNVRFSYVNLLTPKSFNSNDKTAQKYSTTILIPKGNKENLNRIKEAIDQAKEEGKTTKWGGRAPQKPNITLYDGDGCRPKNGDEFGEECKGHWVLNTSASGDHPPLVVGLDRQPIIDQSEIYSGMYGDAVVAFYPYNSELSKGIGCSIIGVMKTKDGEVLGSSEKSATSLFGSPDTDQQAKQTSEFDPQELLGDTTIMDDDDLPFY